MVDNRCKPQVRTEKSGDGLAAAKPEKESPPPTGWADFTWFSEATLIGDCLLYANDSMPRTCPSLPAGSHPWTCTDPQTPWLFAHKTHYMNRKYPKEHSAANRSGDLDQGQKDVHHHSAQGAGIPASGPGQVLQPCTAGHKGGRPPRQPVHRRIHHTNRAKHSAFTCIKFQ